MGNRPLTQEEIIIYKEKIKIANSEIATREAWIAILESEIKNGKWVMSDESLAEAVKDAQRSRKEMEDWGLICATGKCNSLLNITCADCKRKNLKRGRQ